MQGNKLTEEQFSVITSKLLGQDYPLESVLADLNLTIPGNEVDEELRQAGFEWCVGCGLWNYDIVEEYCEFCQSNS